MGHKVNPIGIRLGIAKDWNSKWYAGKKHFAEYLSADLKVREMLRKKLAQAGISKILIERPANNARVTIHTARPGVVIGKRGEDIEKLRKEVSDVMGVPAHITGDGDGAVGGSSIVRIDSDDRARLSGQSSNRQGACDEGLLEHIFAPV